MKTLSHNFKQTVFLTVVIFFSFNCFSQPAAKFKMEFLPQRSYLVKVDTKMETRMDAKGDSVAAVIESLGGVFPMNMASSEQRQLQMVSGSLVPNSAKFPLSLKFNRTEGTVVMNGMEMPSLGKDLLDGSEVSGWGGGKNLFEVDTTGKKNLAPEITALMVMEAFDEIVKQIKFPDKPMYVGDTLSQGFNLPLSIPGMETDFPGNITYKLVALNNDIADFDIVFSGSTNLKGEGYSGSDVVATITGGGKMKFSRAEHFFTEMTQDMAMNFKTSKGVIKIDGGMKTQSVYTVLISTVK